jgi:hypothetical protein
MLRNIKKSSGTHAKNFTHTQAQARLKEVMPRVKASVANSDLVNSAEIMYFSKHLTGKVCSCQRKSQAPSEIIDRKVNQTKLNRTKNQNMTITHHGTRFGEESADKHFDDNFPVTKEEFDLAGDLGFILADSVDCGVCYRTGVIPAFTIVGAHSVTVIPSSGHIFETSGYNLNTTKTPETLVRVRDDGYVKVCCVVPDLNYTTSILYSVRNNKEILYGVNLLNPDTGLPILNKLDMVQSTTEKTMDNGYIMYLFCFMVKVKEFTHINLHLFSSPLIKANISEESLNLDYATLNTLSNITMTIPSVLHKVAPGDLVYVPSRNLCIKISEYSRKNTVDFDFWEYTISGRQLQPQETLLNIPTLQTICG